MKRAPTELCRAATSAPQAEHRAPGEPTALPVAEPDSTTALRPSARGAAWADLMRRAFEVDVLACPRFGGRSSA